jgi:hypothetical protein
VLGEFHVEDEGRNELLTEERQIQYLLEKMVIGVFDAVARISSTKKERRPRS